LFLPSHRSGQSAPDVTGVKVVHRHGQTFVTWKDAAEGEAGAAYRYSVYRSDRPITAGNLGQAERCCQGVLNHSARLFGTAFNAKDRIDADNRERGQEMITRHRILLSLGLLALAAAPSLGAQPAVLKIHLIGFGEYEAARSLADFKKYVEQHFRVECTASLGGNGKKLDNLEALKSADVLILFARRMNLPKEQMAIIRQHWEKGKAIVGVRTACHAFQKKDNEVFDRQVLGGNYGGPASNGGFLTAVAPGAEEHPVLKGVGAIKAHKYAYGNGPLARDVVVLQVVGRIKDRPFPVTWVHTYKGGRVFYTSLGAPEDFPQENFRRLLTNAIFWTAKRDPERMKK
jgi:type 1 glutamine amidotransferase